MGFWDRFKKKPKEPKVDSSLASTNLDMSTKLPSMTSVESASNENVRVKVDLVLTQMESVNIRMETISQRLDRLERMIQEIWTIAKRP